jgi:hypothetical protein
MLRHSNSGGGKFQDDDQRDDVSHTTPGNPAKPGAYLPSFAV